MALKNRQRQYNRPEVESHALVYISPRNPVTYLCRRATCPSPACWSTCHPLTSVSGPHAQSSSSSSRGGQAVSTPGDEVWMKGNLYAWNKLSTLAAEAPAPPLLPAGPIHIRRFPRVEHRALAGPPCCTAPSHPPHPPPSYLHAQFPSCLTDCPGLVIILLQPGDGLRH